VNNKNRHQKLLALLKKVNQERKKQAKQIDILCNDMIGAQRDFIKRLKIIDFRANFYESIMGATDLNSLLAAASVIIKEDTNNANTIFFLRHADSFDIYTFDENQDSNVQWQNIENCFNAELMTNICKTNKICSIEDMFAMGLQGNLTKLNELSAITIPLGSFGSVQGFMLMFRSSEKKLNDDEIKKISSITSGLSQAIYTCKILTHSSE
jgi:transcriptional regulator with GAF, ATPase, and Fis domain